LKAKDVEKQLALQKIEEEKLRLIQLSKGTDNSNTNELNDTMSQSASQKKTNTKSNQSYSSKGKSSKGNLSSKGTNSRLYLSKLKPKSARFSEEMSEKDVSNTADSLPFISNSKSTPNKNFQLTESIKESSLNRLSTISSTSTSTSNDSKLKSNDKKRSSK
jgi:hypothetical protein